MFSRSQRLFVFFLLILLSVSVTLFRMDTWFTTSAVGVWVFKGLVLLNPVLLAFWLSRVFRVRWWLWLVLFGLVEGGIRLYIGWLADRNHLPARGFTFFRNMVQFMHRNVIQYDPALSQFDPELYYTLKPNVTGGSFRNLEYDVAIRANRAGVRDDDASLDHPRVIFLGDSFTMGWGVPDSACYASRLEQKLACRLLNAGVSSYGTAREITFLKRFQTDSCQLLVMQYCTNDDIENGELIRLGFHFKPADRDVYQGYVHYNDITSSYFPFKFNFLVLKTALSFLQASLPDVRRPQAPAPPQPVAAARRPQPAPGSKSNYVDFFEVLRQVRTIYRGPILLFNLEGIATHPDVMQEFSRYLARHPMPGVYLTDVSPVLSREDYFVFDDHLTATGHEKVATSLYETIRRERLLPL